MREIIFTNGDTKIEWDREVNALYVSLHGMEIFPAVLPETKSISEDPHVAVDIISNAVVGIEILL